MKLFETWEKATSLAKDHRRWNQATGPISATICSVLEASWKPSTPGFWQAPEASASLGGALFKAQIIESFSKDMETQMWKKAAGHHHRLCQEGQVSTDQRKKFHGCARAEFSCLWGRNEPHLPADKSIPNQFFCVRCDQRALATRKHELWECPGNSLINHTHDSI